MWKSKLLLLSTTLVLLGGWSKLSAAQESSTISQTDVLRAADHVGYFKDDHVRWRTSLELKPSIKNEFDRIELTRPLAPNRQIIELSPPNVEPVRDAERRVTGLKLPDDEPAPWKLTLVTRQPITDDGRLRPPLIGRQAPQRVTIRGAKFSPADDSALVAHPGFVATENFGEERRERIEASFDDSPLKVGRPIFVDPSTLAGAGLPGKVVATETHKHRTMWVLGGVLVAFVALAAAAYRWLASRAKEEEAEAILDEYGDELGI